MLFANILLVVVIIVGLVVIHELGHFLTAKMVGIKVEEFGIGYPPKIVGKKWRGVLYTLNWLPLGGFVRLNGEFGGSADKRAFNNAPVLSRILVVVAGVLMNFVLAWVLLTGAFMVGFSPLTQTVDHYPGAKVLRQQVVVANVLPSSAAAEAAIMPGDVLISGNGEPFNSVDDLIKFTADNRGQKVDVTVDRAGSQQSIPVNLSDTTDAQLGTAIISDQVVRLPFWSAVKASFSDIYNLSKLIVFTVGDIIKGIFTTEPVPEGIVGPIGIFQITAQAASSGASTVLALVIILSVNFALINILPFPALDGGRLVFLLLEGLFRRRVVKEQVEAAITATGFILLLMLIILLTYRDIVRLT